METHRLQRTFIDPKVRQVGFFTPAAPSSPTRSHSAPIPSIDDGAAPPLDYGDLSAAASLSPVMIPPPRHNAVPVPHSLRSSNLPLFVGSYNPSEPPRMTSPSSSRIDGGSEFSDLIASSSWAPIRGVGELKAAASSLPGGSSEEMMAAMNAPVVAVAPPPRSSFTTASVVKIVPGLSEKGGAVLEMQNEGTVTAAPKPVKQKTSKADRRSLQEAQRAAKAAAKEAGGGKISSAAGAASNSKQGKAVKPPSQKKDVTHVIAVAASEKKVADRLPEKDRKKDAPPPRMQFDDNHRVEKAKRRALFNQFEARNRVELFRHLPQYIHGTQLPYLESNFFQLDPMHPSVYKCGF